LIDTVLYRASLRDETVLWANQEAAERLLLPHCGLNAKTLVGTAPASLRITSREATTDLRQLATTRIGKILESSTIGNLRNTTNKFLAQPRKHRFDKT